MSDSVHMTLLKEITPHLPSFPDSLEEDNGISIHKMTCGTSIAFALMQQDEISVAKWFNSCGAQFPLHVHEQMLGVNASPYFSSNCHI